MQPQVGDKVMFREPTSFEARKMKTKEGEFYVLSVRESPWMQWENGEISAWGYREFWWDERVGCLLGEVEVSELAS